MRKGAICMLFAAGFAFSQVVSAAEMVRYESDYYGDRDNRSYTRADSNSKFSRNSRANDRYVRNYIPGKENHPVSTAARDH